MLKENETSVASTEFSCICIVPVWKNNRRQQDSSNWSYSWKKQTNITITGANMIP